MTNITVDDYDVYCAIVSGLERAGYRVRHEELTALQGATYLRRPSDGKQAVIAWAEPARDGFTGVTLQEQHGPIKVIIEGDDDDGMPRGSDFIG